MIMEDKDALLVEEFLHQTMQDIPDNGFTDKVMEHIPAPSITWDRVTQWVCYAIVASVIAFGGGLDILRDTLSDYSSTKKLLHSLLENGIYITTFVVLTSGIVIYNLKDILWEDD